MLSKEEVIKKFTQYLCNHNYIKVGKIWNAPTKFHLCMDRDNSDFVRSRYQNEICIKCGKVLDNIDKGKALIYRLESYKSLKLKNAALAEQMYIDRNRS